PTYTYTLSLHDALPISRALLLQLVVSRLQVCRRAAELIIHGDNITFELCWNFVFGDGLIDRFPRLRFVAGKGDKILAEVGVLLRSEEHTSELQSLAYLV